MKILIKALPAGHLIYRVREHQNGEIFDHVDQLGPPPPNAATQANRMNPPGIPYFYGAETAEIAIMETGIKARDTFSMGVFELKRQIIVLDLFNVPEELGFFAKVNLEYRQSVKFIRSFSEEISKPITKDDRMHLDYIPTQVISELIRDKLGVYGIRYKSSYDPAGVNIVLFISPNEIEGSTKRGLFSKEILEQVYAPREVIRLIEVKHGAGNTRE